VWTPAPVTNTESNTDPGQNEKKQKMYLKSKGYSRQAPDNLKPAPLTNTESNTRLVQN